MMESEILKFICANQGAVNTEDLLFNLDAANVSEILSNRDKFVSCCPRGQPTVVARTSMTLCRRDGCQGTCRGLHLCKNYLFSGGCRFTQLRRGCNFSHELNSLHNQEILREHGLESLSRTELCTLLLQSDNTLLPPICFDYNNGLGEFGRCEKGYSCNRLHICEGYLNQGCSCFRAHDFNAPQPLRSLKDKGVPDELFHSLKAVYTNKAALRSFNRANRGTGQQPRSDTTAAASGTDASSNRGRGRGGNRGSRGNRDKTEICMYFIKGHCKHEDKCFKAHDKMPYRWEVKEGDEWKAMVDNEAIEKDYCDPKNTYSSGSSSVHFDTMTSGTKQVRRLSTVNSLREPTFIHTTEWLWYWEDEFGSWNQYASPAVGPRRAAADIDSAKLEQKFLDNDKDVVEFTAGSQSYTLSFQDMIQTNKQYGTKRLVKRRPSFVSAADVKEKRVRRPLGQSTFAPIPAHWDKSLVPTTGYKRIPLQRLSEEFKEIEALFCKTMRGYDMVKIERIQNKSLWEVFQWQKNQMKNNNKNNNPMEKQLFHGTDSKYVDAICSANFDWRICGTHGTAFGKGSYFARDAKYSHNYTDSDSHIKSMFVSRVLVGDFTKGSPDYRRPPSKDGGDVHFFDSCVDDVIEPSIFVVFEKHQIYPEYLLQYKPTSPLDPFYGHASAPATKPAPRASVYQPSTVSHQPNSWGSVYQPSTSTYQSSTPSFQSSTPSFQSSTSSYQSSTPSHQSSTSSYQYSTHSSTLSHRPSTATYQPRPSPSSSYPTSSPQAKKKSDSCVIA
ncbi:WWE and TCCD_inducible_PARP_like domain-containing protein isoform X3 [Anabas testudineus]|uniref:WWE and TCCD_inducible_PARP_like domain-containing protein isoform X3 n=1 Tax=Anabas testudineus TaxID=64144 RepID=UPI000E4660B8|nr:WWE and TCCD_inducible_PARP_like domain-containing protein isoform X3 [Anabas testudineus]